MSTNLSQQRRARLHEQADRLRQWLEKAPAGPETQGLLDCVDALEQAAGEKRFGLVFEQHEETVDALLADHLPVWTAQPELSIPGAGLTHFLLEGDNLAALRLLAKTHRGKVDLIYIDPPYNTGSDDFTYDDRRVSREDGFRHSKWLSMLRSRLALARPLLTEKGCLVCSIGHQEVHALALLCQELFRDRQTVCVTVQTSGGKPSGGFNYLHEYLLFVVPADFAPGPLSFAGGNARTPFEGMTLSTFTQVQRPGQAYPVYIDTATGCIAGVGLSLAQRVAQGGYTGPLADFRYDPDEAPAGTVAVWPISSKGQPCVWRLIPERLRQDWEKGYIRVAPNRSSQSPNAYSLQYLPAGVIRKIESGALPVTGTEPGKPTLTFGENRTAGSAVPTIWTEKAFFTARGTAQLRAIFGDKRFTYPKPLDLMKEILRAAAPPNGTVLDFFAGSGTTGHAVLALNREEGAQRRFVLCTNNENDICRHVTRERLRRVMADAGDDAGLYYARVDYLPAADRLYYEYADELLDHIGPLARLAAAADGREPESAAVAVSDEALADILAAPERLAALRTLYVGGGVLLTGAQTRLLAAQGVTVLPVPEHFYPAED